MNWGLALKGAAAAGTALFAWKKLGISTREELGLRTRLAGSALLGNPVAYRVTLLKGGTGPGIAVSTGPSVISQCTVVGVNGNGFHLFSEREPEPGADADVDEDDDSDEPEDDPDASDAGEAAPNVVPAVCENGHTSYPAAFIRVRDASVYKARTPTGAGTCPWCGKPRTILAGEYRAGADGLVTRTELTA